MSRFFYLFSQRQTIENFFYHLFLFSMKRLLTFTLVLTILSVSFASDAHIFQCMHPERSNVIILLSSPLFSEFKEEWKGKNYYYISQSKENGIVCSIMFYTLTDAEQKALISMREKFAVPKTSPAFPFTYYTTASKVSKDEINTFEWGSVNDEFMFRHADIEEIGGMKVHQKNMYGYAMIDDDIFATIHLSKLASTAQDSVAMRTILQSLTIQRK